MRKDSSSLVRGLEPYTQRIDEWIEREFAGYGMAGDYAPSVDGTSGPAMSMVDAKRLTRTAVLTFLLMSNAHK